MKPLQIIIVLGAMMIVCAGSTLGCTCENQSPKKAITRLRKSSSAIPAGEVTSVNRDIEGNRFVWRANITLTKLWKGSDVQVVTVFTEGGCAAWFEVGRVVIVYATQIDGILSTNVCMRTRVIEEAAEDLKWLGKPIAVRNCTSLQPSRASFATSEHCLKGPPLVALKEPSHDIVKSNAFRGAATSDDQTEMTRSVSQPDGRGSEGATLHGAVLPKPIGNN